MCTFTNGNLCGYTLSNNSSLSTGSLRWSVFDPVTDQAPATGPVPINDHSTGSFSSGYVYTKLIAGTTRTNDTATMTSKLYDVLNITARAQSDQFRCLEFYYYFTSENADLNVIF